jgi:hypothetical protein
MERSLASKHEIRDFKISLSPYRPGLNTAGQQTSAPETDAWELKNCAPDLDGMISKRPGLTKWGQTIKAPDATAGVDVDGTDSTLVAFSDFLGGTSGYAEADSSSGEIEVVTQQGALKTNVGEGTSNESYLMSYIVGSLSSNDEWSLRFQFRGTNLSAYDGGTTPNTFVIRGQGTNTSTKEFAIWSGGLYWKRASDSKYVLVVGAEQVGNGTWQTIEIRCDNGTGGSTTVYVNEVLAQTLTSADLENVAITGVAAFEMRWEVEGTEADPPTNYSTRVSTIMYNDTITDPFVAAKIVALKDYRYVSTSGALIRSLLMAAGDYVYHDKNLEGSWRPLKLKTNSNVFFAKYRTTIVWSDNNGAGSVKVWQWDGSADPVELDDAPSVRFLVEHQQRLFGWGDVKNPRRLYYSGDRQPNVWFSPAPDNVEDQFDVLLDAGYVELESKSDEIVAVEGDYYGLAIIGSTKGFWKLAGHGTFSYQLAGLRVSIGPANAHGLTQVGNDVWAFGKEGLVSLAATEQFGDIQASFPGVAIQNLWNPDVSSGAAFNQTYIQNSRITFHVRSASVYFAAPLINDQRPVNIYVYNMNMQKLYGPWEVDAEVLETVEVASPVTDVVMVGGADGRIGYFNPFTKRDFAADGYTMTIQTQSINGRTQDPRLITQKKTFKQLRLGVIPRGSWDIDLTWWTDLDPEEITDTRNQIPETSNLRAYVLDDDFRLDEDPDSFVHSGEELETILVPLDKRGRDLTLKIEQSGEGEDLAIQSIEIEGSIIGDEAE